MKKSVFLYILMLIGLAAVSAEQALDSGVFSPEYSLGVNTLQMWNFSLMAEDSDAVYGYDKFSIGGKLGIAFGNILFGLGSYIAGEWVDGLVLTLCQGAGIALFFLCGPIYLDVAGRGLLGEGVFWKEIGSLIGTLVGIGLYGSAIINGFCYPFGFSLIPLGSPPSSGTGNRNTRNSSRSWNISFFPFPDGNGNVAGHFSFGMSF
jgi:hypothetical protein